MKKLVILLLTVALIAGLAGCDGGNGDTLPQNLEIYDWHDLDAIRNNLAGNHTLMNDLDSSTAGYEELASPTANEGKGWNPIGFFHSAPFTGRFNGQGHDIRDLFINRPGENYIGLFGYVDEGGYIENINVVNANVIGGMAVGGMTGGNSGIVSTSYSTGSVSGNDRSVGGLVGYNRGTVSDSYSNCNVSGDYRVGGLVGENDDGTVSNSYSSSNVTGNTDVGGLLGVNGGTVSDSYFTGSIGGITRAGGLVGNNYYGATVSNSYYDYDEVLINGENVITRGALLHQDFEQWLVGGKFLDVNEKLSQEDGYYLISDVNDFNQLLAFGEDAALKFRLTNDLDLAAESGFYIPYLAGEFDGNSHAISNFSFNFTFVQTIGLFGYIGPGANLADLAAENVNIAGDMYVGGLVGYNRGTVSDSYSTGSVTGKYSVGGLVGYVWEGSVSDSYSTSSVTGSMWYVGGLVGNIWGGIVSDSYSTGSVTGVEEVGGLVAYNEHGTVNNCHSSSNVMGEAVIGGLVAESGGTVSNSYSSSDVTGNTNVGGLLGVNGGIVSNSYSSGDVTAYTNIAGGLVGENLDTVSNSYSTGSVAGNMLVGGLVGQNRDGSVSNCYATGIVTGVDDFGGLVGENRGSVTNSFWDTETSGQATSDGGTGKTTVEMQDMVTFSGATWDIIAVANPSIRNTLYIWNIVDGETYAFLSWQFVA